jgi:plasmid stability protein
MAQVIVRNLEDDVKAALQERARRHGRSMEEELRDILRCAALAPEPLGPGLGSRIAARFADIGLDAPLPELRGESALPMPIGD